MRNRIFIVLGFVFLASTLLAACAGANTTSSATTPTQGAAASNVPQPAQPNSDASISFDSQTVEGGNVAVKVTLLQWQPNAPLEFDIAMDTHSVELADDMLKAVVLRDDSGLEYAPSAWDGPAGGGHHREGKIKFAPLTIEPKSLTLVVKNIAGVPERVFKWELTQ